MDLCCQTQGSLLFLVIFVDPWFLRNGGIIDCTVTVRYRHSADLSQGGLDVPSSLRFAVNDEVICKKLEISSLSESGVEYPDPNALSGTDFATSQKTVASQMIPAVLAVVKKETEVTNGIPAAFTIENSKENIDAEGLFAHLPRREQRSLILSA